MTDMTKHFLPDYGDWGDISTRIEQGLKALEVPYRRVQKVEQWTGEPPFNVFYCKWHHRNSQGPLTAEKFQEDLTGAIADFVHGLKREGEFRAYPITHKPPVVQGIAYHDWCGGAYPFDIRAIITLDESIPVDEDTVETGLTFNITTLLENLEGTNVIGKKLGE